MRNVQVATPFDMQGLPPGSPQQMAAMAARAAAQEQPASMQQPMPGPASVPLSNFSAIAGMPQVSAAAMDPLAKAWQLPSRSLFYPDGQCPNGYVRIAPLRGAQEELTAGLVSGDMDEIATMAVLRPAMEQCLDLCGLPFDSLLVPDWSGLLLQWLAHTLGTNSVPLPDVCPSCGRQEVLGFDDIPCCTLRVGESSLPIVPPTSVVDAQEAAFLNALDGIEDAPINEIVLPSDDCTEPFTTGKLPMCGHTVSWRYQRIRDIGNAEKYAEECGGKGAKRKSMIHTFMTASQITHINGEKCMLLQAMQWVRQAHFQTLQGLRTHMMTKAFGYKTTPRIRCKTPNCGRSYAVRVPLDGRLFRTSSSE